MRLRGAVLERIGAESPYAVSRPLSVRDIEAAPPGSTECVVRIDAAGVCHSDLSVVDGTRPRPVPMLLGHEASGRIVETGSGVTDVSVGDRVVMTFLPRCGQCRGCRSDGRMPCERGSASNAAGELLSGGSRLRDDETVVYHHLGVSAFADYAIVDRRSLVPVPEDVPADIAALLGCAVLTGGGAVWNAARPQPGEMLAIIGFGGVGAAAMLTALAEPDVDVVVIDPVEGKRDLAEQLGARRAMSPEEALDEGLRADRVVEASGSPAGLETGIRILATGGVLAATGLAASTATVPLPALRLVAEALTIRGSYLGSSVPERDIPRFVDLWRQGRLPLERLISGRIGLDDVNEAMDLLASGSALRQVITP